MKHALLLARILLGLPFLVIGLNFFLRFMDPGTEDAPEEAARFLKALETGGFMHPMRSVVEATTGALLILGLFVPLALVMLAPVLAHIIAYHLVLDSRPGALAFTSVLLVLFLVQAWLHRKNFAGLFRGLPKEPSSAS